MELRQLVYFEAVARHGGFTRAAEQLHVAQSAVSAQVRALETELGVRLFARTTRQVALTEAGEMLLHRARRAMAELDGARADLSDLGAVLSGRLALGATAVLGGFDLPAALADFHRRYPGVGLSLRSGLVAELLAELDAGTVDLVVGPMHDDLPGRFVAHRLASEEVALIVPSGHRLAGRREASMEDLRDELFVCLPAGSGLRAILDEAAARAGWKARVPFESHSPAGIRDLVAAGLGVALLAGTAIEAPGAPVVAVPVSPAPAHPDIGLIRRRDRPLTPAARAAAQRMFPGTAQRMLPGHGHRMPPGTAQRMFPGTSPDRRPALS